MKRALLSGGGVILLSLIISSATDDSSPSRSSAIQNIPSITTQQKAVEIPSVTKTEPRKAEKRVEPEPSENCNPNYSGCLFPNASDYDCAGGSGNGPHYTGPVQVLGYDQYDLDRDNDGWGCE